MPYCPCDKEEASELEEVLENTLHDAAEEFAGMAIENAYGDYDTRKTVAPLLAAALAYNGYLERMHGYPKPD